MPLFFLLPMILWGGLCKVAAQEARPAPIQQPKRPTSEERHIP
jgi:hypothetical protein